MWGWTEEAATGVAAWSELKALVSFVLVVCLLQRNSGRAGLVNFCFVFSF